MDSVKVYEKISGKIEQVSDKGDRYGIKIKGTWYNGLGKAPGEEGDYVSFEYEDVPDKFDSTRTWKNVRKILEIGETNVDLKPADTLMAKRAIQAKEPDFSKERIYADIMRMAVDIVLKRSLTTGVPSATDEISAVFTKLCLLSGMEVPHGA